MRLYHGHRRVEGEQGRETADFSKIKRDKSPLARDVIFLIISHITILLSRDYVSKYNDAKAISVE